MKNFDNAVLSEEELDMVDGGSFWSAMGALGEMFLGTTAIIGTICTSIAQPASLIALPCAIKGGYELIKEGCEDMAAADEEDFGHKTTYRLPQVDTIQVRTFDFDSHGPKL